MPSLRSAAGANFAATASPVMSWPPTIVAGDIIEAAFVTDTSHDSSGTPPTGWSKRAEGDRGTDSSISRFWYRAVGGESGTLTWTSIFAALETGRVNSQAWQDSITTGDPWDPPGTSPAAGTDGINATSQDTPVATPSVPNCLAIGYIASDPAGNPTGFVWNPADTQVIGSGTTPSGQNALLANLDIGVRQLVGTPANVSLGGDYPINERPYLMTDFLIPAAGGATVDVSWASTGASAPAFTLAGMVNLITLATLGRSAPAFTLAGMTNLITVASLGDSQPSFSLVSMPPAGSVPPLRTLVGTGV